VHHAVHPARERQQVTGDPPARQEVMNPSPVIQEVTSPSPALRQPSREGERASMIRGDEAWGARGVEASDVALASGAVAAVERTPDATQQVTSPST